MLFNPHKLGVHKVLQHIPLNALFDAPYQAALKKAVNIADLRLIAKSRAHKVRMRNILLTADLNAALPQTFKFYFAKDGLRLS